MKITRTLSVSALCLNSLVAGSFLFNTAQSKVIAGSGEPPMDIVCSGKTCYEIGNSDRINCHCTITLILKEIRFDPRRVNLNQASPGQPINLGARQINQQINQKYIFGESIPLKWNETPTSSLDIMISSPRAARFFSRGYTINKFQRTPNGAVVSITFK